MLLSTSEISGRLSVDKLALCWYSREHRYSVSLLSVTGSIRTHGHSKAGTLLPKRLCWEV